MSKIQNALKKLSQERQTQGLMAFEGSAATMKPSFFAAVHGHFTPKESGPFIEKNISHSPLPPSMPFGFQSIMLVALTVITVLSLILNVKMLSEMRTAKNSSSILAEDIVSQKKEIDILAKSIYEQKTRYTSQIENLKTEIGVLAVSLKKSDEKALRIADANQNLSSSLADLKWTAQNLTDKFIALSAQVKNLQEK